MESVIYMNNLGFSMIQEQDFKGAVTILGQGLAIVQKELDKNDDPRPEQDKSINDISNATTVHACLDAKESKNRRQLSLNQQHNSFEGDEDFVYQHPIKANQALVDDTENGLYVMSEMLVFNMALAHHIAAIKAEGKGRKSWLEGALELYELAFLLQMGSCDSMDITVAMAMANNCAHICKTLDKRRKAQEFNQHMLSLLLMLVENGETDTIDELDGFLWNASKLILQADVVAAAA